MLCCNAVGNERGNERGGERGNERDDETGDERCGERGVDEENVTHEVVGGSATEGVDAIRAGLADLRLDLGWKVAVLQRKVQYLEEYLEERLPKAPNSPGSDPELGEVEGAPGEVRDSRVPNTKTASMINEEVRDSRVPNNKTASMINEEADEAFYELTVSMWDAGLLLFIHDNQLFDKVILISGILLNLGLQTLMFAVIVYNLLDNDFSEVTVREMVKWRVTNGHSSDNFDTAEGQSLARKLCEHELWSYEGREYEDMYNFLFRRIPGQVLSVLAIILWTLTTMTEHKKCTSQFLSILHLPRVTYGEQCIKETARGGSMVVTGITNLGRILVCVILILPRLTVALLLMVAGSKYLAQTVALSDIVLNTVALGFVMEVDESVAEVMLTERLHHMVQKIKPLSCGKPHSKRDRMRDSVRYTMSFGMILFAFFYWVTPFVDNVKSAASALCGGELDFSYSGGTAANPDITLMPATVIFDSYHSYCPATANRTYQGRYYPQFMQQNQSSVDGDAAGVGADTSLDWQEDQMLHVLRYAFSADSCGEGRIRSPPKIINVPAWAEQIFDKEGGGRRERGEEFEKGQCDELPVNFLDMIPSGVHPGRDPIVEDCGRFDISLHERACIEPAHPGVCIWSWEAQVCEGTTHPGVMFQSACRSSLWRTCETWERGFNTLHPTKNCEIVRHCSPESPRCLQMEGWLEVTGSNVSDLADRATDVRELVSSAFGASFNVRDPWVAAGFYVVVVGGPAPGPQRRLEGPAASRPADGDSKGPGAAGDPRSRHSGEHRGRRRLQGDQDDSCQYARDGVCDEPEYCSFGTDCSDCSNCPPPPCQCADNWDAPFGAGACANQHGCPSPPACDGDELAWCVVANPDCQGAVQDNPAWFRCVPNPDCTSTDGGEAAEFPCTCGSTTCAAGTSCLSETSTCRTTTATTTTVTMTTTTAACIDTSMGATDNYGDGCDEYSENLAWCGDYDTIRFIAGTMCCACGGGIPVERYMNACADPHDGCVLVFYNLTGVHEDLPLAAVLGANRSIADFMSAELSNETFWGSGLDVDQVRFNEASVRYYSSSVV